MYRDIIASASMIKTSSFGYVDHTILRLCLNTTMAVIVGY